MYDPTYRNYPYSLTNIPAPPPPPPPPVDVQEKSLIRILFVVIVLVGIVMGISIVAANKVVTSEQVIPTIPSYRLELVAVDFPSFLDGFKHALSANDYQVLASVEDGNHFVVVCFTMVNSSCGNDWSRAYSQLTKHELHLTVGTKSSCFKSGSTWIFVDGTFTQSVPLAAPSNGKAIFRFNQHTVGGKWYWDSLFLDWPDC